MFRPTKHDSNKKNVGKVSDENVVGSDAIKC